MSDKQRIQIFSVLALILLIGAIVTLQIRKAPILQQITQIINNPLSTSTKEFFSPPLPVETDVATTTEDVHLVSPFPQWLSAISASSTATSTKTAATTTLTYEDAINSGALGIGCSLASTTISLSDLTHPGTSITFNNVKCPASNSIPQSYFISGNTIMGAGINSTIAEYWFLDDKKPEDILSSLINSLPSQYERSNCIIVSPEEGQYEIRPDDALYALNQKAHPSDVPLLCGNYGLNETNSFFEQLGNILLYIHVGQDIPSFDPRSFKLAK